MKKFFTLIAAVAMAASMNAQKISFDPGTLYAAGKVPASFSNEGLVLKVTDTSSKMSVDANSQYFGDADSQVQFGARLKTGAKSTDANFLTLTLPSDGTLKIYARSGKSADTNRNLVLTQDGTELYNKVLLDADAVKVPMWDSKENKNVDKSVFPVVSVSAKKGDVVITYPTNSVNFYGFELVSGTTGITNIDAASSAKSSSLYNLAGQQVNKDYKGVVIQNGKKFLNK